MEGDGILSDENARARACARARARARAQEFGQTAHGMQCSWTPSHDPILMIATGWIDKYRYSPCVGSTQPCHANERDEHAGHAACVISQGWHQYQATWARHWAACLNSRHVSIMNSTMQHSRPQSWCMHGLSTERATGNQWLNQCVARKHMPGNYCQPNRSLNTQPTSVRPSLTTISGTLPYSKMKSHGVLNAQLVKGVQLAASLQLASWTKVPPGRRRSSSLTATFVNPFRGIPCL
jgi:hypothetical protein